MDHKNMNNLGKFPITIYICMYVCRTYPIKLCKIHKKSNDVRHVINFMSKCTGMIEGLDLW